MASKIPCHLPSPTKLLYWNMWKKTEKKQANPVSPKKNISKMDAKAVMPITTILKRNLITNYAK